ncbi:MAG: CDP-alcohol phosphatidyltransferase family protein [Thermoplasmata archaeon]
MTDRWRVAANLATLANACVGVGAIVYTVAGNRLWGLLLIVCGVAFDGMDGLLSRRSTSGSGGFGRVADSIADAITFGLAPATIVLVHTNDTPLWSHFTVEAWVVASLYFALAVARLSYFTVRGYHRPDFLGAPTPQSALAVVIVVLALDYPGFLGTTPLLFFGLIAVIAILMVVPIPFPKIRRGSPLRTASIVTGIALVVALVPLQFRPPVGSFVYELAGVATAIAGAGTVLYYAWGPHTVAPSTPMAGGA